MKKYSFFILMIIFLIFGCDLTENAVTTIDKKAVFSSEEGLLAYSWSFYNILPTLNSQHMADCNVASDYGAPTTMNSFILRNAISENNSGGWSWSNLRNINYFIVNCVDPAVPEDVRNNYIGIARFFRAYFYFSMVKQFGDVPWVDRPLNPQDEDILYAPRDSRELVMEKVYEDLMFAVQNITRTTDGTQCSVITKWTAYALASRICLFEGTFRKYHDLNLTTSAAAWLKRAEDAAYEVMQNSGKTLHSNYRELFISEDPPATESILALACSGTMAEAQRHSANYTWSAGVEVTTIALIRPFVCTYLQKDGTPYTDRSGWQYEDFYEEFQNRDERMSATLRYPGYKRDGNVTLPVLNSIGRLGYQSYKFCMDPISYDMNFSNTNALHVLRYAEVLLNYAEAKAEQGTLTDSDWDKTIGALRRRAGITGGSLATKPTVVDNYLKTTYYPDISDPAILEIRRERAVELSFEGFRFDDLRRWKRGELFKNSWTGMYISGINQPLDIDHNGTHDVIYYTEEAGRNAAEALSNNPNAYKVPVSTDPASQSIQVRQAGNNIGYYLTWYTHNDHLKVWGPKQYLHPIPIGAQNLNPNLGQNPGWEKGATNDGN